MVANAAACEITALNLTVSGGGFERTVRGMAEWIAAPNEDEDILFMVPELNSHRRM